MAQELVAPDDTTLKRFWAKVAKGEPDECWLWTGALYKTGYGAFWYRGRLGYAHRASHAMFTGDIPEGAFVCHRCDVRQCVNHAHLFVGSTQDNHDDMWRKGRGVIPPPMLGENHPRSVLTADVVKKIKQARSAGERLVHIASRLGVSYDNVCNVVTGKVWKHISET